MWLATALLLSCDSSTTNNVAELPAVEVSVYRLVPEVLFPVTSYPTRLKAFDNAALVARIEAPVLKRHVEGGEHVKRGDVLISLDPTDANLEVLQAEADVTSATASLSEAQRNLERGMRLSKTGSIPAIEIDQLKTNLETAQARIQSVDAELAQARVTLGYTEIKAPIDGIVGMIGVSIGSLVGPASGPILTISSQNTLLADIDVGEVDILGYNQRVIQDEELDFNFTLRLPNGQIYPEKGVIFSVANTANPATGTMTVRIAYANPDELLVPGQSATVLVSENNNEGRLAVPQSAVQQDQRGAYVMVIDKDMRVSQRHLQLGKQVDSWWLVNSGLSAGEMVVTQGLQKVRAGNSVSIRQ